LREGVCDFTFAIRDDAVTVNRFEVLLEQLDDI
jgi:hypothetical protein